ncbi:hypothetical protein [Clostridium senegalense]|uniref:hypothetical protein n=1 Tax=Clostridium senegalense TaxID=1465809 RepID=UPI000289E3B0|nr:hypothetical protein [Clostridium senegalense]
MIKGKEYVIKEVLKYVKNNTDIINVISYFYNTATIFLDAINYCISNNKSVLYIVNEEKENIELISYLENNDYVYLDEKTDEDSSKVNFCDYNRALYLDKKYDLVIFDELGYMPFQSKKNIKNILSKAVKSRGTIISYSIEPIFDRALSIYFPLNKYNTPLIEPRVITTKIDMEEDLPLVAYEYISWTIATEKKTIIYVPSNDKVISVYLYMDKLREKLTKDVFYFIKEKKDKSSIKAFLKSKTGILITDDYDEFHNEKLTDINIMVFFADDKKFNYKNLVYLVSKIERAKSLMRKEIIFICKDENEDIEKAKSIMRNLNKKGWEEGFIRLQNI